MAMPTPLDLARDSMIGRMGLIRVCKTLLRSPGEPRLHSVTVIPADTAVYMGANIVGDAGAVGFTHAQAIHGAIGECVERYSCAYINPELTVYASKQDLGDDAIGMDEFAIHTDDQYDAPGWPFPRWRADHPITWVRGRSLLTGARRYVPASLVYVPWLPSDPSDMLTLAVSTGQSCHTDFDLACLTGLYEVVERDAFMITWLRKLRTTRIDYHDDAVLAQLYQRHFAGCDLAFHVFDMTTDLRIPSMLCVVEGRSHKGAIFGMGASTRLSEREAISKALLEAAQDMIWCRDLVRRKPDWRPAPDWSNIRDFQDHVRLYCEPEMRPELAFLLDGDRRRRVEDDPAPPSVQDALARALDRVRAVGLDCILVDTTAPDVAAAGFHAPKILIPGAAPLTAPHSLPALGSPRLQSVPRWLGQDDRLDGFNPIPHPFP
jgi:ribosomal protein S12 methylthiotransferase accessory factor